MRNTIITLVLATLVLGLTTPVTALTDRTSSPVFALDFRAPVVTLIAPDTTAVIGGGAPIRFVWEAWDHNPRPDATAVQLIVYGDGASCSTAVSLLSSGSVRLDLERSARSVERHELVGRDDRRPRERDHRGQRRDDGDGRR